MKTTEPPARERSKAVRARRATLWLAAAVAGAACLVLLSSWRKSERRAVLAELRLKRTRVRLRAAEAELMEADEYLAAQGELLKCYMEEFGPLPVSPFAAPAGDVVDEWQEVLEEVGTRED